MGRRVRAAQSSRGEGGKSHQAEVDFQSCVTVMMRMSLLDSYINIFISNILTAELTYSYVELESN